MLAAFLLGFVIRLFCMKKLFLFLGMIVLTLLAVLDLLVIPALSVVGFSNYSYIKHTSCIIFHPNKEYQKLGDAGPSTDFVNSAYWCKNDNEVKQWIEDHSG